MTEADLVHQVDDLMRRCGYRVDAYSQDRRTRSQLAGHPDRIYIGRGRLLYVEFKVGHNGLTPAEVKWWDAHRGLFNPPHTDGQVWRSFEEAERWVNGQ